MFGGNQHTLWLAKGPWALTNDCSSMCKGKCWWCECPVGQRAVMDGCRCWEGVLSCAGVPLAAAHSSQRPVTCFSHQHSSGLGISLGRKVFLQMWRSWRGSCMFKRFVLGVDGDGGWVCYPQECKSKLTNRKQEYYTWISEHIDILMSYVTRPELK